MEPSWTSPSFSDGRVDATVDMPRASTIVGARVAYRGTSRGRARCRTVATLDTTGRSTMHRTLIVARLDPANQPEVAQIFATSGWFAGSSRATIRVRCIVLLPVVSNVATVRQRARPRLVPR